MLGDDRIGAAGVWSARSSDRQARLPARPPASPLTTRERGNRVGSHSLLVRSSTVVERQVGDCSPGDAGFELEQDRRGVDRWIMWLSEGLVPDAAFTARTRRSRARRGYRLGRLLGRENGSAARLLVLQGFCARRATRRAASPGRSMSVAFISGHTVRRALSSCLAGRLWWPRPSGAYTVW
jgi:hypothetical protein